jgi:uncharacterized protein YecT (DUF1311 family)
VGLGWRRIASLVAIAVATDANAASFDCARAARPQEKLVCSDPVLSKLDEQMAATYWANRALLSEPGRRALLDGQRSWLRYWPRDCSAARATLAFDADAVKCATNRYEKRIEALKVDTAFDGRFTVYNVANYAARWTPSGEGRWFVVVGHAWIYPQIDLAGLGPADVRLAKSVNAWLAPAPKAIRETMTDDASTSSTWTSLRVVSRNILGAKKEWEMFGDGALHSMEGLEDAYVDRRYMRPLRPEDIFQGKEWVPRLAALAFEELKKQLGDRLQVEGTQLSPLVSSIDHWTLERDGLEIHFREYQVASYADGMPTITIPWAKVASYLTEFAKAEFTVPNQ